MKHKTTEVAYFSMEFAFNAQIPNYAGGLGVLAADTMLSCADMQVNAVGVSLIYHQDDDKKSAFDPSKFMIKRAETTAVTIEEREVKIAIWQMDIVGKNGHIVPIFFLSTNLPQNPKWDRDLTKNLYASNGYTRLCQEIILGVGGVRALNAIGYDNIQCYHMNEGHSAPLTLELLRKNRYDENKVKKLCTFTTHTPIAAGHDYFDYNLAYKTINKLLPANIKHLATGERMGMTQLALNLSRKANSVAKKHQEVCSYMFPNYKFDNVTNGIYHLRWVGDTMKNLYDQYLKDWRNDPSIFKTAVKALPDKKLEQARKVEKNNYIKWINANPDFFAFNKPIIDDLFDEKTLTITFARRFVPYKRADLIFKNLDRLRDMGHRKLQLVFAGHCHPDDIFCNNLKESIKNYARKLRGQIKIAVLPDYNLDIAKRLITGSDVWLNNPVQPQEASGTSGMKAALNGILNLSILDGWWIEGFKLDPQSGWAFGTDEKVCHLGDSYDQDSEALLIELEKTIKCYYDNPQEWIERMKHAITLAAYFNTHRLVKEYREKIWKI